MRSRGLVSDSLLFVCQVMGLVNDVPILVGLWLYERGGGEEKEELRMFACDCHELHDRARRVQ